MLTSSWMKSPTRLMWSCRLEQSNKKRMTLILVRLNKSLKKHTMLGPVCKLYSIDQFKSKGLANGKTKKNQWPLGHWLSLHLSVPVSLWRKASHITTPPPPACDTFGKFAILNQNWWDTYDQGCVWKFYVPSTLCNLQPCQSNIGVDVATSPFFYFKDGCWQQHVEPVRLSLQEWMEPSTQETYNSS